MNKLGLIHPLDATTLDILRQLRDVLTAQGTEYFLIGATARDVLLKHVFDIPTGRATRDMDFALALGRWEAFERIRQALIASGRFTQPPGAGSHRLHYDVSHGGFGYPLT